MELAKKMENESESDLLEELMHLLSLENADINEMGLRLLQAILQNKRQKKMQMRIVSEGGVSEVIQVRCSELCVDLCS